MLSDLFYTKDIHMSYIKLITKSKKHNLLFFQKSLFIFCITVIMMTCGNTCIAQETEQFKLVKNVTELQEGDIVIVVNNTNEHCSALSTIWDSNKIDGYKIDIYGETITAPTGVDRIQLQKDTKDNWLLFSTTYKKYLCNDNKANSYNNKIALRDKNDYLFKTTAQVTISIKEYARIEFLNSTDNRNAKRILAFSYAYNTNKPNIVGTYNSYDTQKATTVDRLVQLYKKVSSTSLILNDEKDNSGLLTSNNGQQTAVILSRTLLADTWNTFCVPFDIDLKDGKINGIEVNVMEYDRTTDHTINFKNATKIEAGKAYLIKPKKDIKDPVFSDVTIKNVTPIVSGDKDGYSFVGIYSPITFNDSNKDRILILSKEGKFLSVRNGDRMKGMRAYFTIPPKTKAEAVRLMINNKPTAITEISTTLSSPEKIFYTDGTYAGTDIKNVKKGIVIKGGKKILVK